MAPSVFRILVVVVLFGWAAVIRADDPPDLEPLPPPAPVEPVAALPVIEFAAVLPYERIDRYAKWQYFAVDRQGHWRPRVAYTPGGAFYLYNGAPYPYTPIRYLNFMTYATD
jgi:hypothetical protein